MKPKQLATLVAYQVELEPEEPPRGTLAVLGYAFEGLVDMYPLILAYPQRSAVHETYATRYSPYIWIKIVLARHQ